MTTDIARLRELPLRLRDTADGIEAGFLADPHGHRAGLIRASADAIDALLTELETLRAREGEMRKALYDASDIAEQHAKFCTDEANAGGSRELFERAVGVRYVAHKMIERMVKALTPASPGEGK